MCYALALYLLILTGKARECPAPNIVGKTEVSPGICEVQELRNDTIYTYDEPCFASQNQNGM